jgi:hypothetical protein
MNTRLLIAVVSFAMWSCTTDRAQLASKPYSQTSSTGGSTTTDESLGWTDAPIAEQPLLSNGDREFIEAAAQGGRFGIESSRLSYKRHK